MTTTTEKYYGVVETAQLIRVQLKKKFPGITFSVRSSRYAGGASIDIHWKFGPSIKTVNEFARMYNGSGFDGMTDCSYLKYHWLDKEGNVYLRETGGGSEPVKEFEPPTPDAIPVRFGSSYVHAHRLFGDSYNDDDVFVNQVARDLCTLQKVEYKDHWTKLFGEHDLGNCTESANQLLNGTSFEPWQEYAGVRFSHDEEKQDNWDIFRVIFKGNPPDTKTDIHEVINEINGTAILRENPAHNGLELVFPSKPGREILIKLKATGWRWSHTGGLWYHKNTIENRTHAEQILKELEDK